MDFKDETKQAEFAAVSAFYTLVSKRPSNSVNKSLLNQLRDIIVRQFGNGAWQELHRATRNEAAETRREVQLVGKSTGGGLSSNRQRKPSPGTAKEAKPGTARAQRIAARLGKEQGGRSVAALVAGVKPVTEKPKNIVQAVAAEDLVAGDLVAFNDANEVEKVIWVNPFDDAASLSAKELVEKYGRDLIFEYLLNAGLEREDLEQKTDRQLANILKKHVAE